MSRARPALFGPVALIGIGVLLLLHNLVRGYSFWTPLLDYWPWLLVAWGALHVAQHVVARATGSIGPRRLGFATVVAALALCLAGEAGRAVRASDGVVFRGFGVRVQVRDPAFRALPAEEVPAQPASHESP